MKLDDVILWALIVLTAITIAVILPDAIGSAIDHCRKVEPNQIRQCLNI